jgi:hypothetical protein
VGVVVVWVFLAATLIAADYRAGTAHTGGAVALAIEDGRGGRVVIASGAGGELVAARAAKEYGLDRARLVLIPCGAAADTDAVVTVIGGALGDLKPAQVWFGPAGIEVRSADGAPVAVLGGGKLTLGGRAPADGARRVHGLVRAAFQVVEFGRALAPEGAETRTVSWAQAVRLGKDATLAAVGTCGCAPQAAAVIAGPAGSGACPAEIDGALAGLLRRLGR